MDQLKQFVAVVKKQHFWILCGLAVLLGLVMYGVSGSNMAAVYLQGKGKISGINKGLDSLVSGLEHPNREWADQVQKKTEDLRSNVRDAWEALYNQQKQRIFVWPAALGSEFITAFNQPTANTDPRKMVALCEQYQRFIKTELRHLGQIVDADWAEEGGDNAGPRRRPSIPRGPGTPDQSAAPEKIYNVYWDSEDQSRLMLAYDWQDAPTPQDVRFAQEEIWVLDAICHAIARTNAGARGPYEAVVRDINKMLVGYDAVDKNPLGEGANRIRRLNKAAPAAAAPTGPVAGDPRGGAALSSEAPKRPMRHKGSASDDDVGPRAGMTRYPRGGPGMGPPVGMQGPGIQGPAGVAPAGPATAGDNDPDAWLKENRYVGPNGRPLAAKDLQNPPTAEYNLMAFRLVLTVDEVRWEKLLLELCNSPLPLEVREVRINVSDDKDSPDRSIAQRRMGPTQGAEGDEGVQHNTSIELRGVAYLINPPNFEKLGLTGNAGSPTGPGAAPTNPANPGAGKSPAAGAPATNAAGTGASPTGGTPPPAGAVTAPAGGTPPAADAASGLPDTAPATVAPNGPTTSKSPGVEAPATTPAGRDPGTAAPAVTPAATTPGSAPMVPPPTDSGSAAGAGPNRVPGGAAPAAPTAPAKQSPP